MTVRIRSFVPPAKGTQWFELGRSFEFSLPIRTTLGELVEKLFETHSDRIGIMVVNGRVSDKEQLLSPGDEIAFYPHLEGG
jgi:molybdopterin converting factor small subunit